MGYESDFVNEELVSFEVEGRQFKYKPITGGDELKWVKECLHVENGELVRDPEQTALCKLRNIMEAPYSKEVIKEKTGTDKEYSDLTDKEKDALWSKIKSAVLNPILIKIQEIESENSELKKN